MVDDDSHYIDIKEIIDWSGKRKDEIKRKLLKVCEEHEYTIINKNFNNEEDIFLS